MIAFLDYLLEMLGNGKYKLEFFSTHLDQSPAFLTSDDFIRSNEIIRTKWLIFVVIGHFVLTI